MSMRYPSDATGGDFVSFSHTPYQRNGSQAGGGGGGGGGIILYMPEDTPAISQGNKWAQFNSQGPLQKFKLDTAVGAAGEITSAFAGNQNPIQAAGGIINSIKDSFQKNGGIGAYAEQGFLTGAAQLGGLPSASHLLALSQGEIYNPNVELIYEGPTLRDYTFTFMFMPKDETDAQAAAAIVKEFKKWSAPELRGQKLGLPHVWHISYSNSYMGNFKQAALRDVSVDYNSGLSMHATFPSGMPIVTTLQLSFTECDFVFRQDHDRGSRMGY